MSMNQPLMMNPNPRAAANIVRQLHAAGDIDQYKRELVQNAIDAGATNIEAGAIRLADLGDEGGVKAAFIDNGSGMSSSKLADYIGELFNGESEVDALGNFNMGGRVSTLPPNPMGVIWASWTKDDPEGAFIHIRTNLETGVYETVSQNGDEGMGEYYLSDDDRIGVPPEEWKHPMIQKAGQGTVVILLGSSPEDHTVGEIAHGNDGGYVYPTTRRQRTDWQYYNAKFYRLPEQVNRLAFMWAGGVKGDALDGWKKKIAPGEFFMYNPAKGMSFRTHQGLAMKFRDEAEAFGSVQVEGSRGKALVHWGIWPETYMTHAAGGESTADESIPLGLFGELFQDEVYALVYRDEKGAGSRGFVSPRLETYGIAHAKVKNRLAILVEPLPNDNYMPATPAPSRHELRLANASLPHNEWGESFAQQHPDAIKARIAAVSGEADEDLEKRLKDDQQKMAKFFSRLIAAWKGKKAKAKAEVGSVEEDDGVSGSDSAVGGTPGTSKKSCGGTHDDGHSSRRQGPKIGGGVKKRQVGAAISVPNVSDDLPVPKWDSTGEQFTDFYDGLLARRVENSQIIWINGVHPHVKQLVEDALENRRASGEEQAVEQVQKAIKTVLARQVMAIQGYRRTEAAGLRGRASTFQEKAMSDEALSAVLLNVLTMETVIANTFRGRRTTAKVKAA